jgi:hypothetical protein
MYFLLLSWLALFVIFMFHYFAVRKGKGEPFSKGLVFDVSLRGVMVGLSLSFLFGLVAPMEERLVSSTPLVSIKTSQMERSYWFLFFGNGKTTPFYEYYTRLESGYKLEWLNTEADNITIIETITGEPALKVFGTFTQKDYQNWTLFSPFEHRKYYFYVPNGTIEKEFKIS